MIVRLALLSLIIFPAIAMADAGDGEFMGYRLGDRYTPGAATETRITTTGNLLIKAEKPVKPAELATVTLMATRETATIGYIGASQWFASENEARDFGRRYFELLRAKYPEWTYGWEVMDAQMNVVEVNLRKVPYNLRLQLVADKHDDKNMWRFTMALGWTSLSTESQLWQERSISEQVVRQDEVREKILQDSDVRGL